MDTRVAKARSQKLRRIHAQLYEKLLSNETLYSSLSSFSRIDYNIRDASNHLEYTTKISN